tara:strand:+ start:197 stop:406 length:210 start_codon:yes stop_codon:yes gene_type:complete
LLKPIVHQNLFNNQTFLTVLGLSKNQQVVQLKHPNGSTSMSHFSKNPENWLLISKLNGLAYWMLKGEVD